MFSLQKIHLKNIFLFQFRDVRNTIIHVGQYCVTNDDLNSYVRQITNMAQIVFSLPTMPDKEKDIYNKIVEVSGLICLWH